MKRNQSMEKECKAAVQKLCSGKNFHSSMQSVIDNITEQYINICYKCRIIHWEREHREFSFLKHIKGCIDFCSSSRFARDMLVLTSAMAMEWDEELESNRKHPAPSHTFIIAEVDEKNSYSTYFYDRDYPDMRLICIHLRKNTAPYDVLFYVLHEMGHYIGCRIRDERIELYKKLALYGMLREIFHQCCSQKLAFQTPKSSFPMKFNDDPNISRELALYPVELRQTLQTESIYDCLKTILETNYNSIEESSKKENHKNGQYSKYLLYMKTNMNLAVKKTIDDFLKVIDTIHIKFKDDIYNALTVIKNDYLDKKYFVFLNTNASQLSEPTADVFMTTIMQISFKEYLKHILIAAWYFWNEKRLEDRRISSFCQFVSDDILRTRILAIASVKNASPNDFAGFWFLNASKTRAINDAAHMLGEMYIEEENQRALQSGNNQTGFERNQNIWNPQIEISNYAMKIAEDKFYAVFLGILQRKKLRYKINAFKTSSKTLYSIRKLIFKVSSILSSYQKTSQEPTE